MYRILVIEDNPAEADVLRGHLRRYEQDEGETFQVVWRRDAFDLGEEDEGYDLIFMDIELPGMSGMETAKALRSRGTQTPLVFVTNLAQYAVRGYEVNALDFVVKPVSYYGFKLRMDKALQVMRHNATANVVIPTKDGMRVARVSELVYVEVRNHEVVWKLDNEEGEFRLRGSLSRAAAQLECAPFTRISNSCLLNMGYVRTIRGSEIHLTTGETLYFSRSRRRAAMDEIAAYLCGGA